MHRRLQLPLLIAFAAHHAVAFTYRDLSAKAWIENYSSPVDLSVDYPNGDELTSFHLLPSLHWSKRTAARGNAGRIFHRRCGYLVLQATEKGGREDGKKRGYRFGDLTKSLIGDRVEKITGKPYEFGDLSRKIDESIKDKVNDLTGRDEYEFGDLSRWVDSAIKGKVNEYTEKENYEFGDLTKTIVKKVASGKYTLDDLFMLMKGLAIVGASISPVAGFLPVKLLVELLNFSLMNDVAGKVTSSLAMELDKRLKKSLLGDENYKLGDFTKSTIANAVKSYTGKDYEFGDVTRKVVSDLADDGKVEVVTKDSPALIGMKSANDMEPSVIEALDKWDTLSEKELKDGIDKIGQYVDLIEKEQKEQNKD